MVTKQPGHDTNQRSQATWWIHNRYSLGVTNRESHFIAEGR
jgi:hypothetical protein